jgi:hypothetical protein
VYCEYNSLKDLDKDSETGDNNFRDHEDLFDSPEEQILHFLDRASQPGWKWRSVSCFIVIRKEVNFKSDSYYFSYDPALPSPITVTVAFQWAILPTRI